jgi:membrane protein
MLRAIYFTGDLIKSIVIGYRRDDCINHAAVISFYAIFSLLPLAMLTVALFAYFLGSSVELVSRLQSLLEAVVPQVSRDVFQVFQTSLKNKGRFGLIGTGAIIVLASFLVTALESALDRVFRIQRARNFFHSRIVGIGVMCILILLFAIPGILPILSQALSHYGIPDRGFTQIMSGNVLFFFVAFLAFLMTVTVIPNHKVYFRYSFIGAIAFTVLTGLARLLFRFYIIETWDRYNLIYNSLTVLIVIIVWIYYMANIYLVCAELVARLQERRLMERT